MTETVAARLFEARMASMTCEQEASDAIGRAAGFPDDAWDKYPWDEITYDYYDLSFELKGTNNDWTPTGEAVAGPRVRTDVDLLPGRDGAVHRAQPGRLPLDSHDGSAQGLSQEDSVNSRRRGKKKHRPKPFNVAKCLACKDQPEFQWADLFDHLRRIHICYTTKGRSKGVMVLDGSDFFENRYEWDIGGVKILQAVGGRRSKEDRAWWGK